MLGDAEKTSGSLGIRRATKARPAPRHVPLGPGESAAPVRNTGDGENIPAASCLVFSWFVCWGRCFLTRLCRGGI